MTMTRHQTTPAPGQRDMSMASLSRSSSGDSLVLEEKKSGDAVDAMMMTTDDLQGKQYLNKPFSLTGRKEFCHMISNEPGSKFLPEKGRYQLYASKSCPSSQLAILLCAWKGLDGSISMRYVTPRDYHQTNWLMIDLEEEYNDSNDSFASLKSDVDVNSMDDIGSICDLYEKEGDQTSHTVPLLYDAKLQTIVNNNADDICHMLKNCFEDEEKQNTDNSRDELYEWMYPILSSWSNPSPQVVLSFCTRQQLNAALNRAVYTLTQQRYLNATDSLTEADLRLFVTLIHYDQICASFSVAQSPLALLYQQPVLMDYCRDIYQQMAGATKKGLVVGEAMADALKLPHQRHLM